MKAVGARDGDVLLLFLLEAAMVGFGGGLAGVGLALFLANAINQAITNAQLDGSAQLGFLPLNPGALLQGEPQPAPSNPDGRYRLYRVGDAVASRNIHAAIFDSLRLCKDL